jgi:hypothetical protein
LVLKSRTWENNPHLFYLLKTRWNWALELAEFAGDKSHISIFANNKKHNIVDVQNSAVALEKACFEKLFELRGQQLKPTSRTRSPKDHILWQWRHRVHQVNQIGKPANAILMEIADLQALESLKNLGTPPGQRSIWTFLGIKKS